MRVLHISAGNLFGGVETLLLTLARQRGVSPEMTPHFAVCFEGRLSSELRQIGVPVHVLGGVRVRRPWSIWRARRKLKEILQRQPCDVMVCHSVWSQAIFGTVARSMNLPYVCWLHAQPNGTHWLERWAKRTRPDAVVCNSRFTAEGLVNLYPVVPANVIYCPVTMPDLSSLTLRAGVPGIPARSVSEERWAVRAELNTPAGAVVIIQVGRWEPLKGHRLHLEALARLLDLPAWECWFVGGAQRASEEHHLEEIKNKCARLKIYQRVRFLGQRSDVRRLLAAADIYCQPNISPDSFGLTFIEGLLAQLPVVTTALGGALEIVDSSCGVLVPPDDSPALASCLRQLIINPALRSRLGTAGPGRARELCDPSRQMARIHDFFRRATKRELAA